MTDFVDNYIIQSERALSPIFSPLARFILQETGTDVSAARVLDLGGGTGQLLEAFCEIGVQSAILIDPVPEMVFHARSRFRRPPARSGFSGVLGRAEEIPLSDETVDLIVSRNSLHMWSDLPRALRGMFRVLKPRGSVFLGRGYGPSLSEDVRKKVKADRKAIRDQSGEPPGAEEPPSPAPELLCMLAEDAGFISPRVIPDGKAYWILAGKGAPITGA